MKITEQTADRRPDPHDRLRRDLLAVADAYCTVADLSLSRVSTLALNDGKRLTAIRNGGDIATGRFEHAMQWFSDRWPDDGKTWPLGVPRPAKSPVQPQPETAS